jgi:hypothetical protein
MRTMNVLLALTVAITAAGTGCGDDVEAGSGGAGGGTGGGAGGGSGGVEGAPCEDDADCDGQTTCLFGDGLCGDGEARHCEYFAPTCGESPRRTVCGCDGQTRAVSCGGDQDDRPGACPPPEGQFWCGDIPCASGTEVCLLEGDFPPACNALPDACGGTPSCECLTTSAGCICSEREGDFEIGCPVTF